jgi:hypothetical protein
MSEHEAVVKAIEGLGKILWDYSGMEEDLYTALVDLSAEVKRLAGMSPASSEPPKLAQTWVCWDCGAMWSEKPTKEHHYQLHASNPICHGRVDKAVEPSPKEAKA